MVLGSAGPAAASGPADREAVLAAWTQSSAASYQAWDAARQHRRAWAGYGFDWTTDFCTHGPERPVGYDFRDACRRHDFGYRNYLAAGQLAAHKNRLDQAFYADLGRQCRTYRKLLQAPCVALAWVYFRAVRKYGTA